MGNSEKVLPGLLLLIAGLLGYATVFMPQFSIVMCWNQLPGCIPQVPDFFMGLAPLYALIMIIPAAVAPFMMRGTAVATPAMLVGFITLGLLSPLTPPAVTTLAILMVAGVVAIAIPGRGAWFAASSIGATWFWPHLVGLSWTLSQADPATALLVELAVWLALPLALAFSVLNSRFALGAR